MESLANLEASAKAEETELKAAHKLEIKTILKRNNIYIYYIYTLHIYCTFVFRINHLHNNEKIFLKTILDGINKMMMEKKEIKQLRFKHTRTNNVCIN